MPSNGTANLIPTSRRSKEEVRENARKGGIKSGEVRRAKKSLAETAKMINELPLNGKIAEQLKALGVGDGEMDNQTYFALRVYQTAVGGMKTGGAPTKPDVKAMKLWEQISNTAKAEQTLLENERLRLENEQLRKQLSGEIAQNYEDLTPLGDLLKRESENADSDD